MMSVPRSALHFKVRKAVPDQRQSASYRFMPELRPVETTGIPLYGWANGDTFCLCHPSYLRNVTGRKSPHFVCSADRFLPTQAVSPFIRCLLYRPLANSCSICDYCLLSFLVCHRIGFIGCECRLSRLILPF